MVVWRITLNTEESLLCSFKVLWWVSSELNTSYSWKNKNQDFVNLNRNWYPRKQYVNRKNLTLFLNQVLFGLWISSRLLPKGANTLEWIRLNLNLNNVIWRLWRPIYIVNTLHDTLASVGTYILSFFRGSAYKYDFPHNLDTFFIKAWTRITRNVRHIVKNWHE